MSTESLKALSKTLGRQNRLEVLGKLSMKSHRVRELSDGLDIGREKVSEALTDLMKSCLVILFKREAISGQKYPMYVASPFGGEILNISDKLDSIKEKCPITIGDFGDGIEFFLKYYLEADFKVNYKVKIRNGFKIELELKGTPCEMKKCDITCEPVIENIVKRFGHIDQFDKADHANCSFKITLIRKK